LCYRKVSDHHAQGACGPVALPFKPDKILAITQTRDERALTLMKKQKGQDTYKTMRVHKYKGHSNENQKNCIKFVI
jgi:hypothetical protein